MQNAQIVHLAKDAGSHEVGENGSVRSQLTHTPADKWGYGRTESGSYHHG